METLHSIIQLIRPNCYSCSIDLKDAYYSVPVALEHQKFLRFIWRGFLYQYTCFTNELTSAPRKFTKLMKPVLSYLRTLGYINAIYIDDMYLQGSSAEECEENTLASLKLLQDLGFIINEKKSVIVPSQQIVMLGFVICSTTMTVRLTEQKANRVKRLCDDLLNVKRTTIRHLASVIGKICSSFPGVEHGQLYYRELEK